MTVYEGMEDNVPEIKNCPQKAGSPLPFEIVEVTDRIRMNGDLVAVKETADSTGHILKKLHITYLCAYCGSDWWD